jgi:hypothetical protein
MKEIAYEISNLSAFLKGDRGIDIDKISLSIGLLITPGSL